MRYPPSSKVGHFNLQSTLQGELPRAPNLLLGKGLEKYSGNILPCMLHLEHGIHYKTYRAGCLG